MSEDYEARAHKQLQIESWSNAARTLLVRGATDGGPFAEQHVTNADKSRATDTFELHGRPTKLQISPSTAPVRRGECYVRATLLLDGEPVHRLSSGYLTDSKTLSWPEGVFEGFTEGPGLIRLLTGTNPAAGAEISETVPTNARWLIRTFRANLVADGNASNRFGQIMLDDGATPWWYSHIHVTAQVAGETRAYHFGLEMEHIDVGGGNIYQGAIPPFTLPGGWRIRSNTGGLLAGDEWAAPYLVIEEWIEE